MKDEQQERLVIDRSAPERLTESEVRAWAGDQRVFISSVMADMADERESVASAVEGLGGTPVLFERLGGRDDAAQIAYLDGVRSSDIYVGILGGRYGIPDDTGYSPTHQEYIEAVHNGLRISVWTTTGDQDGRQQDFLAEVRVFHTTGSYSTPDQLAEKVSGRLRGLAEAAASPWCKLGPAVFRARRFTDTGGQITVEAALRDDDVVAALEALRPAPWARAEATRVTCAGRTRAVRVDMVAVEATAGRARHVRVEATPVEDTGRLGLQDFNINGWTAEALGELAVRVSLLGESNPLDAMSFLAEMPNPLAGLSSLQLSEDAFPAIAEVLLVEELVGSGRADRITAMRLGPARFGRRRLLEWLPRRRFVNVRPELRSVEGEMSA